MDAASESYQQMLQESIQRFFAEYQKGVTDFSAFSSIFFRLLQASPDPPLETVWFYSALTFHSSNFAIQDPVLVDRELFQLLVTCSALCNSGLKRIALLAPVIYELYRLVSGKKGFWLNSDIEFLIEGIVSYMSICCCNNLEPEVGSVHLGRGFLDVIRVWTVGRLEGNCAIGDNLRVFFPLVSDEICEGVGVGCGVGYLAGIVMSEAFIMRLCLKFGLTASRTELEKDMRNWAVQMISGFRNFYFLDSLLRMLLEPVLPVTSLLSAEDEVLLRNILYDAVIMEEYTFLKPQKGIQVLGNHLKNTVVTWLFVAENAILNVRENGDQTKAISYINAFSESQLPSQLIKWVAYQCGIEKGMSGPNVSTPIALIKWLLTAEEQGVRVFDHNISKLHDKAVIYKSRGGELPLCKADRKNICNNVFFYTDSDGSGEDKTDADQEMIDSLSASFLTAACTADLTTDGRRKRKGINDEGEMQVKHGKVSSP